MTYPLHQDALGGIGQFFEAGVTRLAVRTTELHLDEFVVVQGSLGFGDHTGCQTCIADQQYGIQGVAKATEILALAFRQFHRARIVRI